MASERSPHHTPLGIRIGDLESNRQIDVSQIPLPRTASSAHSNPSNAARGRSGSIQSHSATHTPSAGHAPRSPPYNVTSFAAASSSGVYPASPPQPMSTTHAGGIQPSASFFHPSRPNHYADFNNTNVAYLPGYNTNYPSLPLTSTVRSTAAPNTSDNRPESTGSDSFAQQSFTTDEFGTGMGSRDRGPPNMGTVGGNSTLARSFSTKVSREPLLPIGQKAKTKVPSRPSVSSTPGSRIPGLGGHTRKKSENGSGGSGSGGSSGGGVGRVRTSLEKFIRRTLSGDAGMSATSIIKESPLPTNIEGIETQERGPSGQYIEFAGPDSAVEDDGTMNITHNAIGMGPFASRRGITPHQRRFPVFNPIPPKGTSASEVPMLSGSGKLVRNYQLHRSQNVFFFKGILVTGGDSPWPFIATLFIVLGLAGTWSGTTAVWWWKNESPAVSIIGAYMSLLTIVNMFATVSIEVNSGSYFTVMLTNVHIGT